MPASWLQDVMGPTPAPRVVSVSRQGAPTPPSSSNGLTPGMPAPNGGQAGGGAPFDLNRFMQMFQQQSNRSNRAGLRQYRALMDSVAGTTSSVNGSFDNAANLMSGMGSTARTQIGDNTVQQLAASDQDLVSRGLGNTTVKDTTHRGIYSDANRAMSDVNERVATAQAGLGVQRAGAQLDLGRLNADSILSRRNVGPDMGMYAQLLEQLARSGGGGSFTQGGNGGVTPAMTGGGGGGGGTHMNRPGGPIDPFGNAGGSGGGGGAGRTPDGPRIGFDPRRGDYVAGGSGQVVRIPNGSPIPAGARPSPVDPSGNPAQASSFGNWYVIGG